MSHDEIVVVAPKKDAKKCLADMIHIMSTAPEWADGLPLAAEGVMPLITASNQSRMSHYDTLGVSPGY